MLGRLLTNELAKDKSCLAGWRVDCLKHLSTKKFATTFDYGQKGRKVIRACTHRLPFAV